LSPPASLLLARIALHVGPQVPKLKELDPPMQRLFLHDITAFLNQTMPVWFFRLFEFIPGALLAISFVGSKYGALVIIETFIGIGIGGRIVSLAHCF
jgi:hypothetical protein